MTLLDTPKGVQDISIVSGMPPAVNRPEGSQTVYLTFEGLRESRTIADKLTRIRLAIPVAQARRLQESLAECNVDPPSRLV